MATVFEKKLQAIDGHIYSPEEINRFRMQEAIDEHPLKRRPINYRSRYAYMEIMKNVTPTRKYLLPGQFAIFEYLHPKTEEQLEYYDATPFVLFFGLARDKKGNLRELGINLHYFPPFARARAINTVYEVYKRFYKMNFNEDQHRVNRVITWNQVKNLMRHSKVGFAVRMYIPILRSRTYVMPTRLLPTASFSEGHFSKQSLQNIMTYWRHYKN